MKQQMSSEQVEWFRQQAIRFSGRAISVSDPAAVPAELPAVPKAPPAVPAEPPAAPKAPPAQEEDYQQFLWQHPVMGTLKVQVYAARGAIPVKNASVTVDKQLASVRITLFRGVTDQSGILENILLPALPAAYSQSPDTAAESGTYYQISVSHPGYRSQNDIRAAIYDQIQTILPVGMYPQKS